MAHDNCRCVELQGATHDLARINRRVVHRPALMRFVGNKDVFAIEKQDLHLLDPQIGEPDPTVLNNFIPSAEDRTTIDRRTNRLSRNLMYRLKDIDNTVVEIVHPRKLVGATDGSTNTTEPINQGC